MGVQAIAITHILDKKDQEFLDLFDGKFFFNFPDEYAFINEHYRKYGNIPDRVTFQDRFKEFKFEGSTETEQYIKDKLVNDYIFSASEKIIGGADFEKNALRAKDEVVSKLAQIKPPMRSLGVDIVREGAKARYEAFVDKMANPNNYTFSTGLTELDMILDFIRRGEELLLIFARTNNGKSLLSQKIACSIWEQGYNVGYFEPEMSDNSVGYRFDTFVRHFDNKALNRGGGPDFDDEKYREFINSLTKNTDLPVFNVTTPLSFDKRATVSAIRDWALKLDLKAIVIDGLTYMKNERCPSGKQSEPDRLTEISEDLMSLSVELEIPIIIVMQANRVGMRDKDGELKDDTPDLDNVRGSDGVAHNCSRVLSISLKKEVLTIDLSKNRYGEVGNRLTYKYGVNIGKFAYMSNPKSGLPGDVEQENIEKTKTKYDDTGNPF